MNFLTQGIFNNGANTNGLSSFTGGGGSITMDIGPWMTQAYTEDAGIPLLVDKLNTLLCSGQLSSPAKAVIVNYVASVARFPYSATPTNQQMRDRVRAVVHLLVSSPEFIVQR
jgi:maltose-binding protein MalE